jgi:hypothetical protein
VSPSQDEDNGRIQGTFHKALYGRVISIELEYGEPWRDGLPTPERYWAAATIWLALTLSVLDGSIANVALPTIAADLYAPAAD